MSLDIGNVIYDRVWNYLTLYTGIDGAVTVRQTKPFNMLPFKNTMRKSN